MANDYFNFLTNLRLPRRQIAKAESVNALFELVEQAFATLPALSSIATGTQNYGVATGISNVYTVSISGVAAYVEGQTFLVKIPVTNTGPSVLNVNGFGNINMKRSDGGALGEGDLVGGGVYQMTNDGTSLRITSALALLNGLAAIASNIAFSTISGMTATDVQAAIAELKGMVDGIGLTGDDVTVAAGGVIQAGTLNAALQRISDALSDDPNFSSSVTTALGLKQAASALLSAIVTLGASATAGDLIQFTGANAVQRVAASTFGSVTDIAMIAMELADLKNSTVLAAGWWSESYDTLTTLSDGVGARVVATPTAPLGGTAANFNDGNAGTTFSVAMGDLSGVASINARIVARLDFGSAVTIGRVALTGFSVAAGGGTVYGLYTSADGVTWTAYGAKLPVFTTATAPARDGVVAARYVALVVDQVAIGTTLNIGELAAYAPRPAGASSFVDTSEAGVLKPALSGADANTILLLHAEGANGSSSFVDSSPSPKTITVNNTAVHDTSQAKFGTSSLKLGAGAGALVVSSLPLDFSGDFTIETWARPVNTGPGHWFSTYQGPGSGIGVSAQAGIMLMQWGDPTVISAPATHVANQWVHWALERYNNVITFYVNGAAVGSVYNASNFSTSSQFVLGFISGVGNGQFTGNIDEYRVSAGVARYKGNFAPPSQPFSAVPQNVDCRFVPQDIGAVPATLDVYAAVQQVDALTFGTDFMVYGTRNNATTWTQSGAVAVVGTVGTATIIKATVTVSGQSSGQLVAPRFVTTNNKAFKLLGHFIAGR